MVAETEFCPAIGTRYRDQWGAVWKIVGLGSAHIGPGTKASAFREFITLYCVRGTPTKGQLRSVWYDGFKARVEGGAHPRWYRLADSDG